MDDVRFLNAESCIGTIGLVDCGIHGDERHFSCSYVRTFHVEPPVKFSSGVDANAPERKSVTNG